MIGRVPLLTIQSPSGITNQIQYSTNPSQSKWVVLTNLLVAQSPYQVIDLAAQSAGRRFYRVADTAKFMTVTLLQLWGSSGRTYFTTALDSTKQHANPGQHVSRGFRCRACNYLDTGLLRARLDSGHPSLLGKLVIHNARCGSLILA